MRRTYIPSTLDCEKELTHLMPVSKGWGRFRKWYSARDGRLTPSTQIVLLPETNSQDNNIKLGVSLPPSFFLSAQGETSPGCWGGGIGYGEGLD